MTKSGGECVARYNSTAFVGRLLVGEASAYNVSFRDEGLGLYKVLLSRRVEGAQVATSTAQSTTQTQPAQGQIPNPFQGPVPGQVT